MGTTREKAIDAVDVLNDIIGDLAAGTNVFREYRERYKAGTFSAPQLSAVQKMCFSHLALALCKLLEFWQNYQKLVPDTFRQNLKNLNGTIRKRGAKDFRNKVAGHIWDKKLQRPLRQTEVMKMLETLLGAHADHFLNWVNDPAKNEYPITVLSVVESLRDAIATQYEIAPTEILER